MSSPVSDRSPCGELTIGLDGSLSPTRQRKACRLAAKLSFELTGENLRETLGSSETLRVDYKRQASRIGRWQGQETASGKRLFGKETAEATTFHEHGRDRLLNESWTGICRLIGEELEREDIQRRRQILDRLRTEFMGHMSRLDYEGRLASGDAIGRGVLERAKKTLGLRLKTRGARWRHKNARSMAALICGRQTEQWDLFSGQAA